MSDPASVSAAASPPPPLAHRSPAGPLFLWLVVQLFALSLAALRVPLAARFPPPGEQFAIHTMLATQIIASALLFPFLLRDLPTSVMVILTLAPFVQLASYLSAVPITRAALAALYVGVWLTTLALWRAMLRSRRGQMVGVASAVALSLGGAVIWYVRAESREPGPIDWSADGLFGPILGAVSQIESASPTVAPWWAACVLLFGSFGLGIATSIVRSRSLRRRGNPPAKR